MVLYQKYIRMKVNFQIYTCARCQSTTERLLVLLLPSCIHELCNDSVGLFLLLLLLLVQIFTCVSIAIRGDIIEHVK